MIVLLVIDLIENY